MATPARLKDMNRSTVHELTPRVSCRDRGRQGFILHTKQYLGAIGQSGLLEIARHRSGSLDPSLPETSTALGESAAFAAWTALGKGAQRRMWLALDDMLEREAKALDATSRDIGSRAKFGTLELDPDLVIPAYLERHAFHGQPGGYIHSRDDNDIRAGALQEAGGTLYTRGAGTGKFDSKAQAVVRYLAERNPELVPRRVLDLGCGYGGQTCGYALAYPEAEVHGVDIGAGLLRYAHLRAESLGIALQLHQQDASKTRFADGTFDLIISNILLHEVPRDVLAAIMRECHRLLATGGLVVHQDVPTQKADMPGFRKFLSMWQKAHNDEPFWEEFAATSVPEELARAGFDPDDVFEDYVAQLDGPLQWYFVGAERR